MSNKLNNKAEEVAATSNMQEERGREGRGVVINVLSKSAGPGLTCCPF